MSTNGKITPDDVIWALEAAARDRGVTARELYSRIRPWLAMIPVSPEWLAEAKRIKRRRQREEEAREAPADSLELTPQARAALITRLMILRGRMTAEEIREMTGIQTRSGVFQLMNNLSLGRVPVYQPEPGVWELDNGRE